MEFDIGLILAIIVSVAVGYKIGQWTIIAQIVNDITALKEQLADVKEGQELIGIESVNGVYFAYGENNKFLAQGSDFVQMFTVIKDRFPDQDFRIDKTKLHLTDDEQTQMIQGVLTVFGNKTENING